MTHRISMVIMSHLSDVQHMGGSDMAIKELNFVKALVLLYPDTSVEVSEEEINKLYNEWVINK